MNVFKRLREKHPNIVYIYAATIMLIIEAVAITLIFTIPPLINRETKKTYGREISVSDITSETTLGVDGSLTFSFENEEVKFITNAETYSISSPSNTKYVYSVENDTEYYVDIEYTRTDKAIRNVSFKITLCDVDGNNLKVLEKDKYTVSGITNGAKARYVVSDGITTFKSVVITYDL